MQAAVDFELDIARPLREPTRSTILPPPLVSCVGCFDLEALADAEDDGSLDYGEWVVNLRPTDFAPACDEDHPTLAP
jgi:hypothetical protein